MKLIKLLNMPLLPILVPMLSISVPTYIAMSNEFYQYYQYANVGAGIDITIGVATSIET